MRKEELNTQYLTWKPSMNKGKNHGARLEEFHYRKKLQHLSLNITREQPHKEYKKIYKRGSEEFWDEIK